MPDLDKHMGGFSFHEPVNLVTEWPVERAGRQAKAHGRPSQHPRKLGELNSYDDALPWMATRNLWNEGCGIRGGWVDCTRGQR